MFFYIHPFLLTQCNITFNAYITCFNFFACFSQTYIIWKTINIWGELSWVELSYIVMVQLEMVKPRNETTIMIAIYYYLFQFGMFYASGEQITVQTVRQNATATFRKGLNRFQMDTESIPEVDFNDYVKKGMYFSSCSHQSD